jgi:hypothetical protein
MRILSILILLLLTAACGATVPRHAVPTHTSVPLFTFIFDDGNDTDYLVAKDIFGEQEAVACSAITTNWINTKDHLSAAQIRALYDAGWEIVSHTASHPDLSSLSASQIDNELSRSRSALENLGIPVDNLVYPYNKNNNQVRQIARKYYRAARGGTNAANVPGEDPYFLKSYANKHDTSRMKRYIDRAYADKSWIIFYHHQVDMKVNLTGRKGMFVPDEKLLFSPSGAQGRYERPTWFLFFGSLYLVPLSGTPQAGDMVTGQMSGATARIDHIIYDERASISELLRYVRTTYSDMRIVTIDQGLDILGVPKYKPHE